MLQPCSMASSNDVKSARDPFLRGKWVYAFRRFAPDKGMSQCFKGWSKSDNVINGFVKWVISIELFLRQGNGFTNYHVYTSIDECILTEVYIKNGKMNRTKVWLPAPRFSFDSIDAVKKYPTRIICKHWSRKSLTAKVSPTEFTWSDTSRTLRIWSSRGRDRKSHGSHYIKSCCWGKRSHPSRISSPSSEPKAPNLSPNVVQPVGNLTRKRSIVLPNVRIISP